ncbi:MAG TPA: ABC transporter ATP-binding protein [Anaerolineaceae bacterium]|nr:ABC transporter ATP-binding protein [Anaerolineaceae bacterium]
MAEPCLAATNITMKFGGLTAIDGVSFDLHENEILGIIGPNGAGKTTVFNVISGLYTPTSGDIRFRGARINGLPPHQIAKMGIKRTFQQSRLFDNIGVLDNVLVGMATVSDGIFVKSIFRRDLLAREFQANIQHALELLRHFSGLLVDNPYRRAGDLVPGERRKLEICRALASDPDVLLLDEPAAGMDPTESAELMGDILKIRELKKGIGIILIEHDMAVVQKTADFIVVLSYGKEIARGSFAEVSSNPLVQEAYLGSESEDA